MRRDFIAFISDVVDIKQLISNQFNLVAAGCGSGKTYWVINNLLKGFPEIKPYEVMFVTSRSITKEQQAKNIGTTKLRNSDTNIIQYWNGLKDEESIMADHGIALATYDQLITAIQTTGEEVLGGVKILILDECHTMFSDTFIDDVKVLRFWLREVIYGARKLVIGLSATTGIIDYCAPEWSVPINRLNKDIVTGYQAKQMICTDFDTIPYLIAANKLLGKTIIMCPSIRHCNILASRMQNAAVVVSPHSSEFTGEMSRIRDYMVKYETLPPTYFTDAGEEMELDVLISTTTLREGFNLREKSGVRNVISCIADELHVTQFLGRCRYPVENLVIANTYVRSDNLRREPYMQASREKFKKYMENKECASWFHTVSHLVEHDAYGTKKFVLGSDDVRFINYVNGKWLVPKGVTEDVVQRYRIWRQEDKQEIINLAVDCKLFDLVKSKITFLKVVSLLQNSLGYEVEKGRTMIDGAQHTYRLVISFDENSKSYVPVFQAVSK